MRYAILLAILFAGCSVEEKKPRPPIAASTRTYQLDDQEYAIVVVQRNNMSDDEAKEVALQRAAEIIVQQGGRYFVIVKEEHVRILESAHSTDKQDYHPDMPDATQYPPPDLYEEIIQRKDTRDTGVINWDSTNAQKHSGFRLTIRITNKGTDACKYTNCKK